MLVSGAFRSCETAARKSDFARSTSFSCSTKSFSRAYRRAWSRPRPTSAASDSTALTSAGGPGRPPPRARDGSAPAAPRGRPRPPAPGTQHDQPTEQFAPDPERGDKERPAAEFEQHFPDPRGKDPGLVGTQVLQPQARPPLVDRIHPLDVFRRQAFGQSEPQAQVSRVADRQGQFAVADQPDPDVVTFQILLKGRYRLADDVFSIEVLTHPHGGLPDQGTQVRDLLLLRPQPVAFVSEDIDR